MNISSVKHERNLQIHGVEKEDHILALVVRKRNILDFAIDKGFAGEARSGLTNNGGRHNVTNRKTKTKYEVCGLLYKALDQSDWSVFEATANVCFAYGLEVYR